MSLTFKYNVIININIQIRKEFNTDKTEYDGNRKGDYFIGTGKK